MANADDLREITRHFRAEGRLEAIVLRPSRDAPAQSVAHAVAVAGRGLIGDRRAQRERPLDDARRRELTLFQFEHLPIVARWCGVPDLDPTRVRRNLVISGVNIIAMRSPFPDVRLVWRIGADVRIEVSGPCDPCSLMEEALGPGGYNALRGHGGMTARLVVGGEINVGDAIVADIASIDA